jgi:hypothetical protein
MINPIISYTFYQKERFLVNKSYISVIIVILLSSLLAFTGGRIYNSIGFIIGESRCIYEKTNRIHPSDSGDASFADLRGNRRG